ARARHQPHLRDDPVSEDLHGRRRDDQGRPERPHQFRQLLRLPAVRSGPLRRGDRDGDRAVRAGRGAVARRLRLFRPEAGGVMRKLRIPLAYALAGLIALLFLYPYWWMLVGAFRATRDVLADPLRLLPESFNFSILSQISRVGGVELWVYLVN